MVLILNGTVTKTCIHVRTHASQVDVVSGSFGQFSFRLIAFPFIIRVTIFVLYFYKNKQKDDNVTFIMMCTKQLQWYCMLPSSFWDLDIAYCNFWQYFTKLFRPSQVHQLRPIFMHIVTEQCCFLLQLLLKCHQSRLGPSAALSVVSLCPVCH